MRVEVELGADAIAYVKSYLEAWGALAKSLAGLPLDRGRVVTYVPPDTDPAAIHQYTTGGLIRAQGGFKLISQLISGYLSPGGRYAIFEDILSRPEDQGLSASGVPYFTLNQEVHYYLTPEMSGVDKAELALAETYAFRLVAALTCPSRPVSLVSEREATREALRTLAEGTEHIIVGAYDGEGYLMWSRR